MSGAEALANFYALPVNFGDVLGYADLRAGEFALYDEDYPMTKIDGFLLNFENDSAFALLGPPFAPGSTKRTDGNDVMFGDTGNDWIVGGTGKDNMYDGWGDDLLNADDDQSTNAGLNTAPDTDPSYEDRAYGGAGRDILIGNTGGDRLIDLVGEFNSYIVPFAPFGSAAVSRTLQPFLPEFLYALSASDGADPTRVADTGADPLRNGEPVGELGLVLQKDFSWKAQTGAPADPQAGNIPGGKRDVLRSATFDNNKPENLFADSGIWQVSGGVLQVAATSLHADAVSVYQVGDRLPTYFEIAAKMKTIKPTAGWNANSFVIFDYVSYEDFKFADINVSTNKLVIGHRDASGWIYDKQASVPGSLKSDTWYDVLVANNGTTSTVVVGNTALSHTFATRVIDQVSYGLNWGLVGFGSNNARGAMDNIAVQNLPPQLTSVRTEDFTTGTTLPMFGNESTGSWSVPNGRITGSAPVSGVALNLIDLSSVLHLASTSVLELSATLSATGLAGVVFDHYSDGDYKWAGFDVGTKQILIGHYTSRGGWVIDQAAAFASLAANTDYRLTVMLKGTTVSLNVATLSGSASALTSHAYNAVAIDGGFGLWVKSGSASYDTVTAKTDDPAVPAQATLLPAGGALAEDGTLPWLTEDQLAPIVEEATAQWLASGLTAEQTALLTSVAFTIEDLDGAILGQTEPVLSRVEGGTMVRLDRTAAGHGWFIDPTPFLSEEFISHDASLDPNHSALSPQSSALAAAGAASWQLYAIDGSAADGRIDLLTTVLHELGHVLGFDDQQAGHLTVTTLMTETLGDGIRRTLSGLDEGLSSLSGLSGASDVSALSPRPSVLSTQHSALGVRSPDSGFSFTNFRGLFSIGSQHPAQQQPATPPVIDWGEEEEAARPTPLDLGGVKLKSSWLSKFLSATGLKQDRASAHDFEVTLPKKK